MNNKEILEFTETINRVYKVRTGNRLILREFNNKWYVCCMIPLGEETLYSGTLEDCKNYMRDLIK